MEERGLQGTRSNYIFTLTKFILFLIIFCFLAELTRIFWREISGKDDLNLNVLISSVLLFFCFYNFLADLNKFYKKVQRFFFHSSFFSLIFPSLLIVLGVGYFFLPKIFNFSFNRNIFVFLGGFIFTAHLTYVAREIKGNSFTSFINYLFIFSILYIFNIVLLGIYLRISFDIYVGKIMLEGMKDGAILIQNIFTQILR